jgi:hypothetical protein
LHRVPCGSLSIQDDTTPPRQLIDDAFGVVLAGFARERDWDRFHSPKNLVMALTSEVRERFLGLHDSPLFELETPSG